MGISRFRLTATEMDLLTDRITLATEYVQVHRNLSFDETSEMLEQVALVGLDERLRRAFYRVFLHKIMTRPRHEAFVVDNQEARR